MISVTQDNIQEHPRDLCRHEKRLVDGIQALVRTVVRARRGSATRLLRGRVDDVDLDPEGGGGRGHARRVRVPDTDANKEVGAVHPKAMPVILTNEGEFETWLSAPWPEAARLQRPLPDGSLRIVARGRGRTM